MSSDKGLEAIAAELKGIRNILASIWHSRYNTGETDLVSPEIYSDEYISTEECAKRLGVTDQTIRNWILQGKKPNKTPGKTCWIHGIHYILIPLGTKKQIVRIPWNQLILSYHKGEDVSLRTFDRLQAKSLYEDDLTRQEGT
jgi:excisionase family DNA binding protein